MKHAASARAHKYTHETHGDVLAEVEVDVIGHAVASERTTPTGVLLGDSGHPIPTVDVATSSRPK